MNARSPGTGSSDPSYAFQVLSNQGGRVPMQDDATRIRSARRAAVELSTSTTDWHGDA